jgi:ribose/xylose/arabinose/galactoside ABC-type transport system permease subunit
MLESLRKLAWPLAALGMLLVFNAVMNPAFFSLTVTGGKLIGPLVDVADRATPVLLVALGMTLVIATAGVDLSVGAVMAISGSLAAALLTECGLSLVPTILITLAACTLAGVWNGVLVSIIGIQPIVATLILMVAGRGIAQLITDGQVITIEGHEGFAFIGGGTLAGLPFGIVIAFVAAVLTFAVVRFTALGLFVESVGGNETASRYAGLNVRLIRVVVYAFTGLLAGIAGLIYASDITAADANNAGLYLELDAILAVVIGGTALSGGRFFLAGSIVGALIIQTLGTTILMTEIGGRSIQPEYNLIVKALVVLAVCLLQSDALRRMLTGKGVDA